MRIKLIISLMMGLLLALPVVFANTLFDIGTGGSFVSFGILALILIVFGRSIIGMFKKRS